VVSGEPGGRGLFWRGVLTGVAGVTAILALCAGLVVERGVTVPVPTSQVSRRIEEEVRAAVRRELPAVLAGVQQALPRQVAAEAGRRLAGAEIDLGGFQIPVPQAAVKEVEQVVDIALRTGLEAVTRQVDLDGLAQRLSSRAAGLADRHLQAMLADQPLVVQVGPLQVPVRLVPR